MKSVKVRSFLTFIQQSISLLSKETTSFSTLQEHFLNFEKKISPSDLFQFRSVVSKVGEIVKECILDVEFEENQAKTFDVQFLLSMRKSRVLYVFNMALESVNEKEEKYVNTRLFVGSFSQHGFILQLSPNGKQRLLCFGQNESFNLGLGHNKRIDRPVRHLFFQHDVILEISVGHGHSFFLIKENRVFSCGENFFGQCGHSSKIKTQIQKPKEILQSQFCYVQNDEENEDEDMQYFDSLLIDTPKKTKKEKPVIKKERNEYDDDDDLIAKQIFHIACGNVSSFILSNSGVYACGRSCLSKSQGCVLGIKGLPKRGYDSPTRVVFPDNVIIQTVASGMYHTLFLDTNGNVWGTGCNENVNGEGCGRLGTSTTNVPVMFDWPRAVCRIGCGRHYSIFLQKDLSKFLPKENNAGNVLGDGYIERLKLLRRRGMFNDGGVVKNNVSQIDLQTNDVWFCGKLFNDDFKPAVIQPMIVFTAKSDCIVSEICAGDQHVIIRTVPFIKKNESSWMQNDIGVTISFGYGRSGELCLGSSIVEVRDKFTKVNFDSQLFVKCYTCEDATFFISKNGEIYGCGSGKVMMDGGFNGRREDHRTLTKIFPVDDDDAVFDDESSDKMDETIEEEEEKKDAKKMRSLILNTSYPNPSFTRLLVKDLDEKTLRNINFETITVDALNIKIRALFGIDMRYWNSADDVTLVPVYTKESERPLVKKQTICLKTRGLKSIYPLRYRVVRGVKYYVRFRFHKIGAEKKIIRLIKKKRRRKGN